MPNLLISQLVTATPTLSDFIEFEPVGSLVSKKTTFQGIKTLIGGGGTVVSVGLAVPAPVNPAFSVTGSPVTTTGTLTIVANGTTAQYIDGTGALRTFPTIVSAITADNGLTANTSTNVQLGGTLIQNTQIIDAGFTLLVSNNTATTTLSATNSSSGTGMAGSSGSGTGGSFSSTSGFGISAVTSSGTGASIQSTTGLGINVQINPTSTNTVVEIARIQRSTSGTAANGIGGALSFFTEHDGGSAVKSNQIQSIFTTAASATRTSQMKLTGVLSAADVDLLILNGDGSIQMRPITATAASAITPAEAMVVFVSNTDATFTSIGFWGYRNGAWAAF